MTSCQIVKPRSSVCILFYFEWLLGAELGAKSMVVSAVSTIRAADQLMFGEVLTRKYDAQRNCDDRDSRARM